MNSGGHPEHGPSPRVWGELLEELEGIRAERTIPTRVGRTDPKAIDHHGMADHPHACGENNEPRATSEMADGPSPRVWGEPCALVRRGKPLRTIPTRVGRTTLCHPTRSAEPDHPHACGENDLSITKKALSFGPSPRVWGELQSSRAEVGNGRTIPTRVGRTILYLKMGFVCADHPHACGENRS